MTSTQTIEITGTITTTRHRRNQYGKDVYGITVVDIKGDRYSGNCTRAFVEAMFDASPYNALQSALGREVRIIATVDGNRFARPRLIAFA